MRITRREARRLGIPAAGRRKTYEMESLGERSPRFRSRMERDYAEHLSTRPDVIAWHYEAVSIQFAPGCRYTPDFLVITRSGAQLHETKGFMREAARLRLLASANLLRGAMRCVVVRRDNRGWKYDEI